MNRQKDDSSTAGMALDDIYFVLFRQKWKILICAILGLAAGGALFLIKPAQYQSEAKLLIRYVVEGRTPNPTDNDSNTKSPDSRGENIINTEIEILTSTDLARQVVQEVGADRILGKTSDEGDKTNRAAAMVIKGLSIDAFGRGSVIPIVFQHPDSDVARRVLSEIITAYFKKHAEMHQPLEMFGSFMVQETNRLRADLDRTEQELRKAKKEAGVISLDDAKTASQEQLSKIRQDIYTAEADLAVHRAALAELPVTKSESPESSVVAIEIPKDKIVEYQNVSRRVDQLSQKEQEGLLKYPETSPLMADVREQLATAKSALQKLVGEYPNLARVGASSPAVALQHGGPVVDLAGETVLVKELETKTNLLHAQLKEIQSEVARVEEMEIPILDLQRKKEHQEANLKYFLDKLEQSRIDGELGTGASSGISIIQSPSPAVMKRSSSFKKKVMMVMAGGLFGGLALAFFIEMILDRSVRRPGEVEKKLGLPLFISIPNTDGNGKNGKADAVTANDRLLTAGENGLVVANAGALREPTTWNRNEGLNRFYAGLRDRLIVNFEVRNLTQNPKLLAVTSCGRGAGVSSIAAGLAASLSETGDGNVLLVNMNSEPGTAQPFHHGNPECGLADALAAETMGNAQVKGNLYAASESMEDNELPRVLPRRFATLMPQLKASDYDYVIFDMPPVSQTSMTPRLAGLMDTVLLVIESEKTSRESVQRANALLAESKANVGAVLNKARSYVPTRLYQEFLEDV
jgi:uncharacterized protein involved in exopolysaccharide biosynthesis/Mrp family chromosome partitioning ATPase